MTIATTTNRVNYTGNGVTTAFSFPYRFLANADLVVILRTIATGVEVTKTLTTHYTVSGAGAQAGGTVTMLTAPTALETLTIIRDPDATQEADFVENDNLPAETLETQLDRAFMVMQRLVDKLGRSAILTDGNTVNFDPTLPALIVPDTVLKFNATGDGFETGPSSADLAAAAANAAAAAASAAAALASQTAAAASASAASTSASNAATSETNAAASAAAAAANSAAMPWDDVSYKVSGDSPVTVADADNGTTYSCDTTGGAIVVNLPQISGLTLGFPWVIVVNKTSSDSNLVTINRGGSDTFVDGTTSKTILTQNCGFFLIPDTDGADRWTILPIGSAEKVLTTDGTQVVTNKDIDGGTAANTRRITIPADTKANLDALTRKAGTVVYATDLQKAFIDNGTILVGMGGGGGLGVNFIGLTSGFLPLNTNDVDAEASVGNWLAYADAAGSSPVDMTGGSPAVTIARTTTAGEVLNGSGSFKVVKGAANRQGEGVAVVGNVPLGYQGKMVSYKIPFKIISGSLVSGDLKLFIYDVTNGQVITPANNDAIGVSEILKGYVQLPYGCAQVRFGFHFASTSATAVTFSFDDVVLGPMDLTLGASMTDWKNDLTFTPNAAAFPTVHDTNWWYRIVGDTMHVRGNWATDLPLGVDALLALPAGYKIDATKFSAQDSLQAVGSWYLNRSTGTPYGGSSLFGNMFYDGSDVDNLYFAYGGELDKMQKANGNDVSSGGNNNSTTVVEFAIPIVGLSTNLTTINNQMFRISNYLAGGTRVTGTAPTQLGEYRSYLRTGNTATYTETNGDPAIAPTAANGVVIYTGQGYTGGDAANQPSRYEIFIGKNKQFEVSYYLNAGRTGLVDAEGGFWVANLAGNVRDKGWSQQYDPITGILNLVRPLSYQSAVEDAHGVIIDDGTFTTTVGTPIYFEVFVSEQIVPVQFSSDFTRETKHLFTLVDNTAAPATIISIPTSSLAGLKMIYGIQRNTASRHSDFWVSLNGASISYSDAVGVEQGTTGITLSAVISGGFILIQYTSTSTGFNGTMNLEVTKIPA